MFSWKKAYVPKRERYRQSDVTTERERKSEWVVNRQRKGGRE